MQKFWCSNICFHSQEQEDTQILYINKNFHPNKMCLRRHSTYLLACFVSCLLFPLASRPSNCRKALDQIFKVCRTALLQRSESRRLEAFKDNHANVSISLGVGENCSMKFWGGPFENENGSEWTPGILLYKHPFSQPTWFCKDKLCTKRFCSMQKTFAADFLTNNLLYREHRADTEQPFQENTYLIITRQFPRTNNHHSHLPRNWSCSSISQHHGNIANSLLDTRPARDFLLALLHSFSCSVVSPATLSRSNYFSYIASLGWIHLCSHSRDA